MKKTILTIFITTAVVLGGVYLWQNTQTTTPIDGNAIERAAQKEFDRMAEEADKVTEKLEMANVSSDNYDLKIPVPEGFEFKKLSPTFEFLLTHEESGMIFYFESDYSPGFDPDARTEESVINSKQGKNFKVHTTFFDDRGTTLNYVEAKDDPRFYFSVVHDDTDEGRKIMENVIENLYFTKKGQASDNTEESEVKVENKKDEPNQFTINSNSVELLNKIRQQLKADMYLEATKKPTFPLPEDIHDAQIDKYYLLGDVFIALVRKPSMNVYLEYLPKDFNTDFAGIIAADSDEGKWEKILTIEDKNLTDKNNPYLIWVERGYLFLSIVDQHGAGSGEGIMKLLTTNDLTNWSQVGCYYFGSNYRGPEEDGDYFQFSATALTLGGPGLEQYSGKECNNLRLK